MKGTTHDVCRMKQPGKRTLFRPDGCDFIPLIGLQMSNCTSLNHGSAHSDRLKNGRGGSCVFSGPRRAGTEVPGELSESMIYLTLPSPEAQFGGDTSEEPDLS